MFNLKKVSISKVPPSRFPDTNFQKLNKLETLCIIDNFITEIPSWLYEMTNFNILLVCLNYIYVIVTKKN